MGNRHQHIGDVSIISLNIREIYNFDCSLILHNPEHLEYVSYIYGHTKLECGLRLIAFAKIARQIVIERERDC